jgi:competence protein ComEA
MQMEQWLERYRGILFFILVAVALVGIILFQVLRPQPQAAILLSPSPTPFPEATPTPRPIQVYISGAVQKPDVYPLAAGSIVKDAMLAAGGPTEDADLDRINLAAPVADGQHVYVPHLGETNLPVDPPSDSLRSDGRVNINTAGPADLETLPGIGPALAQRIYDYRQANGPFARIEDLMDVSGIGQATFDKIRDLVTTE